MTRRTIDSVPPHQPLPQGHTFFSSTFAASHSPSFHNTQAQNESTPQRQACRDVDTHAAINKFGQIFIKGKKTLTYVSSSKKIGSATKKPQLQICIFSFFLSGLSVMHISNHSPFHGADSQDHGRSSVEHISKHRQKKKLVHTSWPPWCKRTTAPPVAVRTGRVRLSRNLLAYLTS